MDNNRIAWCETLKVQAEQMADQLRRDLLKELKPAGLTAEPEQFGYAAGEKATDAIQSAIDYVSQQGGGIVRFANGDYVTGSIVLKSGVTLEIEEGSRLLGSTDLSDYPEHIAKRRTVQDTSMGMHQSLIFAEGCENIGICGKGIIDGRGLSVNFPGEETATGTPGRPFLMRIIDCKKVTMRGITLKDAACWMQNYLNCEDVVLDGIHVENQSNFNNDGVDIDGCRRVIIRNCYISSGDDSICFKGAGQARCEFVLVENCELYSSCNTIKIGTDTQGDFCNFLIQNCQCSGMQEGMRRIKNLCADSGVSLEMMDGGLVENIYIRNLTMKNIWSPFFFRMADRGRVKPEEPKPGIGTLHRILIENVTGSDCGPRGSYLIGAPEKPMEDIVLKDITIRLLASERPVTKDDTFDEMTSLYPDAHMIDDKGDSPAFGFWARHVRGLYLVNYHAEVSGEDKRPEYVWGADTEAYVEED